MNTNYAETGVRVGLRKVGNDVHLDLETDAGKSSVVFDDSKSVYSALHAVKDELAMLVSKTVDSILSFVHRTDPAPALPSDIDEAHEAAILEDAARAKASLDTLQADHLKNMYPATIDGLLHHPDGTTSPNPANVALISTGDAAAVLDGKQVATPVAQPDDEPPTKVEGRGVPITTPTGEKPAA